MSEANCSPAGGSVFLANLHHMCAQTDGSYRFPNSREGDMLKTAKREIETLRAALIVARDGIADQWHRDVAVGTPLRNASLAINAALSPNSDSAKDSR